MSVEEKSTVLGIRLDAPERKRFDEFVTDEGKNNKEFLNTLLNLYELNKGKVKNINLVGDIEVLEGYTNKIHQSFINMIDKLESQKNDISENSSKDLQIYKDKVNNLKDEFNEIKSINSTNEEKLISVNNDNITLKEQSNQLYASLQDKLTIIEEYKSKNDTLTGLLNEYKQYKIENEEIKGLLADAQSKGIEKENLIKEHEFTINNLNGNIDSLRSDNKKSIEKLKADHEQELQTYKKLAKIDKEMAILDKDKEHQKTIEDFNSKHNKEIEEYQAKYKNLLGELEKARVTHTTTRKNNAAGTNKQNK